MRDGHQPRIWQLFVGVPMQLKHWLRARRSLWLEPLEIIVVMRLAFAILAFVAWYLYPKGTSEAMPAYAAPDFPLLRNRLYDVWGQWDTGWYISIARSGYGGSPKLFAFLPLYPVLLGLLGRLGGGSYGSYLFAGLILSTLAAWLSLILLRELVRLEMGDEAARRAIFYLAVFPTAFYLCAAYTEPLFLALVLGAFLSARHYRKWWLAGLLASLAALTRSLGVFLVLPLAWEWWSHHEKLALRGAEPGTARWRRTFGLVLTPQGLATMLPALALAGWMCFATLYWNVPLTASLVAQSHWKRSFSWPWITAIDGLRVFLSPWRGASPLIHLDSFQLLNLIDAQFLILGFAVTLGGMWSWWRGQLATSYLLFLGIGLTLPLTAPTPYIPLVSYPRFVLVLFPIYILMAQAGGRWRVFHLTYSYVSLMSQGVLFMRWANWFWVA
jgi:hypothetical protein